MAIRLSTIGTTLRPNFTVRAEMPNDVEMLITSEGDNGILFEGTEGTLLRQPRQDRRKTGRRS